MGLEANASDRDASESDAWESDASETDAPASDASDDSNALPTASSSSAADRSYSYEAIDPAQSTSTDDPDNQALSSDPLSDDEVFQTSVTKTKLPKNSSSRPRISVGASDEASETAEHEPTGTKRKSREQENPGRSKRCFTAKIKLTLSLGPSL